MSTPIDHRLHVFATTVLERRGALVDWAEPEVTGTAMLPADVIDALGAADEVLPIACDTVDRGLCVSLGGDFLEWSRRLVEAEPRIGTFRVPELYLKRKGLEEAIQRTFTWLNAKVTLRDARSTTVEYHTWWFHGSLRSEDQWDTRLRVSVNSATGVEVEIPDPLGLWELEPNPAPPPAEAAGYERAVALARQKLICAATDFLARMDSRLQRDRKRLQNYYGSLFREAGRKKPRGKAEEDPDKIAAKKRAVRLEFHRKLAELDERYAMQAVLTPVVLMRTELPVLAVDVTVLRKRAQRGHTVCWNPLLKQFEPMACSVCARGTFAVTFTNESVEPLCTKCGSTPRT